MRDLLQLFRQTGPIYESAYFEDALRDLEEQLEAAQAENRMLRMWLCTDGARARGLAESMTELPIEVSLEGVEENSRLIVELLNIEQRLGLPSACEGAREQRYADIANSVSVLGRCVHGVDLDREFCPRGCRV